MNFVEFVAIRTECQLLLKYFVPFIIIGIAYGNASTPIRRGGGPDGKLLPRR
jgi:hypothetical protein